MILFFDQTKYEESSTTASGVQINLTEFMPHVDWPFVLRLLLGSARKMSYLFVL